MKVFGLTGGIASGKSSVAHFFEMLGAGLIDADALARAVVAPGLPAYDEILRSFGKDVRLPDGGLDRRKLRQVIFKDAEARKRLEAIVHPQVMQETAKRLADEEAAGSKIVIYEAALLVEGGLKGMFDALIVVHCDPERQIERLMARDGVSRAEAESALASQAQAERRLQAADYVIYNDGELAETEQQVRGLYKTLKATLN